LSLILATTISVGNRANLTGFEKKHLGDTFICINFSGKSGGIGELKGNVPLPFRF
jgi:hypothetical protein